MARGTVSEAYRRLAEQGRVRSRAGGGTVVVTAAQARTTDTDSRRTAPLRLSRGMPDLAASGLRQVLVTPVHQFPTGAVLTAERRTRLLA